MNEHVLVIQGVTLGLISDNLSINPWEKYPVASDPSENGRALDVTIALHGVPSREAIPSSIAPAPSSTGVRFMDTGLKQYHLLLYQDDEDLILDFQDIGLWRIHGATGRAEGYLIQDQEVP